jgi:hypothetical protein
MPEHTQTLTIFYTDYSIKNTRTYTRTIPEHTRTYPNIPEHQGIYTLNKFHILNSHSINCFC